MITQQHWTIPRQSGSPADFAMTRVTVEVDRHIDALRAEAEQRRPFRSCRYPMRVRIGHAIMHLGEAVSGVRLHSHVAGQHAA